MVLRAACQDGNGQLYGENRITMILGKDRYLEEAPYDEERQAWEPIRDVFTGEISTEL